MEDLQKMFTKRRLVESRGQIQGRKARERMEHNPALIIKYPELAEKMKEHSRQEQSDRYGTKA